MSADEQNGGEGQMQTRVAGYGKPARFVNNFSVSFGPGLCRLVLGETPGPDPARDTFWSDVFAMPTHHLVDRAQLILQAVQKQKAAATIHVPQGLDVSKFGGKQH